MQDDYTEKNDPKSWDKESTAEVFEEWGAFRTVAFVSASGIAFIGGVSLILFGLINNEIYLTLLGIVGFGFLESLLMMVYKNKLKYMYETAAAQQIVLRALTYKSCKDMESSDRSSFVRTALLEYKEIEYKEIESAADDSTRTPSHVS